MMRARTLVWGAHASGVLVSASCGNELKSALIDMTLAKIKDEVLRLSLPISCVPDSNPFFGFLASKLVLSL